MSLVHQAFWYKFTGGTSYEGAECLHSTSCAYVGFKRAITVSTWEALQTATQLCRPSAIRPFKIYEGFFLVPGGQVVVYEFSI